MRRTLTALFGIFILISTVPVFAGDCGDVNNSGAVGIQDITYLINYLYKGGPEPFCCGDVNNSTTVNIQDITFLINFLYKGGPEPCSITVTDIDGNVYQTVTIGTQVWMSENLKVTHYRNGDVIPNVTDNTEWAGLTTGAYCEYNNDISNVATYGRLYNWYSVNDSRNIAPSGWHVPTDAEWKQLEMHLGLGQAEADAEGPRGTDEGGKLKESGTNHWNAPNTGATNESGFCALPGGYRYSIVYYGDLGTNAYLWSSTELNSDYAWYRRLDYNHSAAYRYCYSKQGGSSIRCVKD